MLCKIVVRVLHWRSLLKILVDSRVTYKVQVKMTDKDMAEDSRTRKIPADLKSRIFALTSKSPKAEAKLSPFPAASSSSGLILVLLLDNSFALISAILSVVNSPDSGL